MASLPLHTESIEASGQARSEGLSHAPIAGSFCDEAGEDVWHCSIESCAVSCALWHRQDEFLSHLKTHHFNGDEDRARQVIDSFQMDRDSRGRQPPYFMWSGPCDDYHPVVDSGYVSVETGTQSSVQSTLTNDILQLSTVYYAGDTHTMNEDVMLDRFTEQLFEDIGRPKIPEVNILSLCESFEHLFAEFALRIGQDPLDEEMSKAGFFLHKNRSFLGPRLILLFMNGSGLDRGLGRERTTRESSSEDQTRTWRDQLNNNTTPNLCRDVSLEDLEQKVQTEKPDDTLAFNEYVQPVFGSDAYNWLLARLHSRYLLTDSEDDAVLLSIQREVLDALPKAQEFNPEIQSMFIVSWPLRAFLRDQFHGVSPPDIGQVMTITGSVGEAQALTCEQYLKQTWPCTGIHLLQLLQKLAGIDQVGKQCFEHSADTIMAAWHADESVINVKVKGTQYAIVDVAEQLSWLSAALRSSPAYPENKDLHDRRYAICKPSVYSMPSPPNLDFQDRQNWTYCFHIDAEIEDIDQGENEGTCWKQMICCAILVHGFPIRRRARRSLGLEISPRIAGELIGTKYINQFEGYTFIKGYSAMLIPILKIGDMIVWHILVDLSGEHISYYDHDLTMLQSFDPDAVGDYRHSIGWCTHTLNYTGAADARLSVRRANLPRAKNGSVLAGHDISIAKTLVSTDPFSLPDQWSTTHTRTFGLSRMFRTLSRRFVLLWDNTDQRGWLVNGMSALLHMVRVSLHLEEHDSVASFFVLKSSHLKEPEQPHSPKAALKFFDELDNLQAKTSIMKSGSGVCNGKALEHQREYELLGERVEQYYYVLEKATTWSARFKESYDSIRRGKLNLQMEGWDFFDLANESTNVHACTLNMPDSSHGWLEWIRSIGVATFFGQGFGELIRPSTMACCEGWRTVPVGEHYIAVNVTDLQKVMECYGNAHAEPRYLSESLLWHNPSTAFESCGCEETGAVGTRLVQQPCSTMKPCSCPSLAHSDFDLNVYMAGAVIFGHNSTRGPTSADDTGDDSEDSGLGSSLPNSQSTNTDSTSLSQSSLLPIQTGFGVRTYGDGYVSGGQSHFGDNNNYQNITNNYSWFSQLPTSSSNGLETQPPQIGDAASIKRKCSDGQVTGQPSTEALYNAKEKEPGPSPPTRLSKRRRTSHKS